MAFKKPVMFISHAHADKSIIAALKEQLDRVFANGLEVFASSIQGINPGNDWFSRIKENLNDSTVFLVVITPVSMDKNWVWFELGAFWSKITTDSENRGYLFPLLAGITPDKLPRPISDLQAISLDKPEEITRFFNELCQQINFGNTGLLETQKIIEAIPNYEDKKRESSYAKPYEGYSDVDLMEILDDYISTEKLRYDTAEYHRSNGDAWGSDDTLFDGVLVHFDGLDKELKLPVGTSKQLLIKVAERYNLIPKIQSDKIARFTQKPQDPDDESLFSDGFGDVPF